MADPTVFTCVSKLLTDAAKRAFLPPLVKMISRQMIEHSLSGGYPIQIGRLGTEHCYLAVSSGDERIYDMMEKVVLEEGDDRPMPQRSFTILYHCVLFAHREQLGLHPKKVNQS